VRHQQQSGGLPLQQAEGRPAGDERAHCRYRHQGQGRRQGQRGHEGDPLQRVHRRDQGEAHRGQRQAVGRKD